MWLFSAALCLFALFMAGCGGGSDGGDSGNPPTHAAITFEKTLGGTANDTAGQVLLTDDGGYIVVGTTSSFGAGGSDVYLVKLDADGNVLWEKTYGGEEDEEGRSIARTADGGYIIAGSTGSTPSYLNGHIYLVKIDALGNVVWERTYDEYFCSAASVQQTADNGYVLTGTIRETDFYPDALILKLDANGDIVWRTVTGAGLGGQGRSIEQTSDGGYVVAGYWQVYSFGPPTPSIMLIKLSSTGEILWQRYLGTFRDDVGTSAKETPDGGYVITGYELMTILNTVYLAKIDADGEVVWKKNYGHVGGDIGNSIQLTGDEGFVVAGTAYASEGGEGDVYLIKTDGQGELLWEKKYGGAGEDAGMSVQQTADGGYIVAGNTDSFGAGGSDIYLIKTDSNGDVE
jgi:predicted Rdx family selenoprotein